MADFKVKFTDTGQTFPIQFTGEGKQFPAAMGEVNVVTVGAVPYEGDYVVTPKPDIAQTLPTKDKLMTDDVQVKAIPYYEMDNKVGTTVFIGNEV